MITEDYVSYEVAKLLKEKGFDEYCPLWYNLDKPLEGPFFYKEIGWYGHNSYDYNGKRIVSAPTHQMACKWLREIHNVCICINMVGNGYDSYVLFTYNIYQNKSYKLIFGSNIPKYNSYEEAVEAAIKYILENLI